MKVYYNPVNGQLKVRPSLGPILGIGIALAGIKIVYDVTEALYITAVRRTHKNLPVLEEKIEGMLDQTEDKL